MPLPRSFVTAVAALRNVAHRFDAASVVQHGALLSVTRKMALHASASLLAYYECLLFMRANPATPQILAKVDAELRRIQAYLWKRRGRQTAILRNSGLPFTETVMSFSHDCTRWLLQHADCRVALEEYADATLDLNTVLRLTLPLLERPHTTAELSNAELCAELGITEPRTVHSLVAELGRFDEQPFVKDHLFDALGVYVRVTPTAGRFSTAGNRLRMPRTFFHGAPSPPFDPSELMNRALPRRRRLGRSERDDVVTVIRNAMALTSRETDPATYCDARSLRLFDLERGISVAIFGMTADRQLGLESYVGFTAFKNGTPAAYGGAWVLGQRAEFGMNIFEPYRGGESGYLMCQLLRVYRETFDLSHVEVDAHQFGLDNPDGIDSGAFWFYYKYGFRPVDRALASLARKEKTRLGTRRGLRTPKSMLRTFTGSNVALQFAHGTPPVLATIRDRVTRMVRREFQGDRVLAEHECTRRFVSTTSVPKRLSGTQRTVVSEMALIAHALGVADAKRLGLLAAMAAAKPRDLYRYQQLATAFLCMHRQTITRGRGRS